MTMLILILHYWKQQTCLHCMTEESRTCAFSSIKSLIHGATPTPLRTLLTLRSKSRNLRGELILVQPRVITTKCGLSYTFKYYGPKIWNSLNDELRTSPTLKKFVTRIRKITFDACNCSLGNC